MLKPGLLLHQKAISLGLQGDPAVCKGLVNLYLACNLPVPARLVFAAAGDPADITLWNALLAGHSRSRLHRDTLLLFRRLRQSKLARADGYTFPSVLKACAGLGSDKEGRELHALVVKSGCAADAVVASSLVGMYAKCGLFDAAIRVFDEMPHRDVASWNTVISCYYQDGQASKTLELFERMKSSGFEPDAVTFTTALSACARLPAPETGRQIHEDLARRGVPVDDFVGTALVDMYGKCGRLESARDVFERIPAKGVVAWNSMIGAYAAAAGGDSETPVALLERMERERVRPTETTLSTLLTVFLHGYLVRREVEADVFVQSSLIDLYFRCGRVGCAQRVFEGVSRVEKKKKTVLWNVVISGHAMAGEFFKAVEVFRAMRSLEVRPDAVTFASVLPACSQLAALEQGREIHDAAVEAGLGSNEIVMSAVLDMYAKCGAVEEARRVFDGLPARDLVSWTSMIAAYGSHGRAREAVELFREMESSEAAAPDRVCFLAVISACSHGGLVEEGCRLFDEMKKGHRIEPGVEHYSCLVDLLGRSGRVEEALELLQERPAMKADAGILGSLFSACRLHRNLAVGDEVAGLLAGTDPDEHHSNLVILSNMYASAGRWEEVEEDPGCSWIEIDGRVHQFFVEDCSHLMAEGIYRCLTTLMTHMGRSKLRMSQGRRDPNKIEFVHKD
ncbi:unnamed protein product [Spirodela intermedia]|uniref:Uncharacterized protein n=1 Tax=Spirodela intermedia TaxID=51605 RepID=A0A7I8ICC2_SPIIN|nr:unnamed protein product [Spirodela intermedia]CAA6655289.1 unnamed protein product [Spirodela intermedia]